ncbi:MAG TPA: ABC transporter permease [Candidatus Acidoferrales bacterium]|nr:ABC transporter permease [Candidatus Acidoferrales bacterium]
MFAGLKEFASRIRGLFSSRRDDREFTAELDAHLSLLTEENIRRGMSPAEARRQAHIRLGGSAQLRETNRELRSLPFFETLWQDLRFSSRLLCKNPGFTAIAVLTLALGIGANTAIFSVVDAVLLRPLPFTQPSRLIALHEGLPKMGYPKMGFSPPDLAVFAREQKSFSAIGSFQNEHVNISGHGEPVRVMAARISASLLPMLGAQPVLGRTIAPEEDVPGHNVVLLGYGLWQRRYGGDRNILGQNIQLDRQPYTIIGVMPQNFEFPLAGPEENGSPADLWLPMAFTPTDMQDWGGSYFTSVLGQLRSGVTLHQARDEAAQLSDVIVNSYPPALKNTIRGARLEVLEVPFQQDVVGSVRTLLLVLMAAVAFVLLIACANVATLLVSRAAARQKEIAVRIALGATRLRLVRQMLTESLLLALGGGAFGLFLAFWAKDFILALVPPSIALPRHVPLHGGVLVFALISSIAAAVLFGLAPAFQVASASMHSSLQEGGRSATLGRSRHRLQGFFVVVEFALAMILLVGAGLLIRSFGNLLITNPGFRPGNVLTLNISLPRQAYSRAAQLQDFYKQLLDRVSNLPGVQTAALSSDLPLNAHEMVAFNIEGRPASEGQTPEAICQSWLQGDYFQTMGIPLLQGRGFTPEDRLGSQFVAIMSLSAARKFWPGQNPLGKRIKWGVNGPWQTVVGVVGDVSEQSFDEPQLPHVYRPYNQVDAGFLEQDPFSDWHAMNISLRTHADPASLASAVLAQVNSLDPDLAVPAIRTMTQVIRSSFSGPEFNTVLLGALAGLALFLAAIGIYGVLAYVVAQQAHEIGIRMALGANPRNVLRLVLGRGVRLVGIGAAFGLAAAVGLTRLMKGLLYGVSAMDPSTFIAVVALLVAVALLASYIPARRAMRVDPMTALRYE